MNIFFFFFFFFWGQFQATATAAAGGGGRCLLMLLIINLWLTANGQETSSGPDASESSPPPPPPPSSGPEEDPAPEGTFLEYPVPEEQSAGGGNPSPGARLPNPLDVPFNNFCTNLPGYHRLDGLVFYEHPTEANGTGVVGVWLNAYYWELGIRRDGFPLLRRTPLLTRDYFQVDVDPGHSASEPVINSAVHYNGRLYLVITWRSRAARGSRYSVIQYAYNPAADGERPVPLSHRPASEVFSMLRYRFIADGLTAMFATPNLDDMAQRTLFVNLREDSNSLRVYQERSVTLGSPPDLVFDLEDIRGGGGGGGGGRGGERNPVWAMDTISYDAAAATVDLHNFRAINRNRQPRLSYGLFFRLSRDAEGWNFRRLPGRLLDSAVFLGCPASMCFDTTMDGIVSRTGEATPGSTRRLFYIFRGRFFYVVNTEVEVRWRVPYPRTLMGRPQGRPPVRPVFERLVGDELAAIRNDVYSVRDLLRRDSRFQTSDLTVEATLVILDPADPRRQVLYLFNSAGYYVMNFDYRTSGYEEEAARHFPEATDVRGPIWRLFSSERFLDPATGMIIHSREENTWPTEINAAWHQITAGLVHFFSGPLTWSCGQILRRGGFGDCSVPTAAGRPLGFPDRLDSVLVHADDPDRGVAFFSGNSWWFLKDGGGGAAAPDGWRLGNYTGERRFMHGEPGEPGNPFFQLPGTGSESNACDYQFEASLARGEVWDLVQRIQTDTTGEIYRPQPSAAERDESGSVIAIVSGVLFLVIALALLVILLLGGTYKKRVDDELTELTSRFSAIASIRSAASGAGTKAE